MSFKEVLLTVSVVLIWGLSFVVIKIGLQDMPPFFLAALSYYFNRKQGCLYGT